MIKRRFFMFLKKILLIGLSISLLTGCSAEDSQDNSNEATIETNINKLKNNAYYVQRDDTYYETFLSNATFSQYSISKGGDSSRVAWIKESEESKIPMMYPGDKIVYRQDDGVVEGDVLIERFYDLGYTIGVCGLKPNNTGRYVFDTDVKNLNINPASDASQLTNAGDYQAVIESIGNAKLRSGNISEAGTIIGLEKDKTYSTDVYIGTILKNYKIKADVRALMSEEAYNIKDFDYMQSKIISITLPSWLNSGYYLVNGYGLFRYSSTGKEWDENTDVNVPNVPIAQSDDHQTDTKQTLESDDIKEEKLTVEEDGKYTITVSYDTKEIKRGTYKVANPKARVVGADGATFLSQNEEGKLELSIELSKGDYSLQIIGLSGRTYSFNMEKVK